MFDIGWSEMAIIALVALIVIGPKDLPRALRSVGQWTRKARMLTREFQSGLDEMIREADLDDARKAIKSAQSFRPDKLVRETIDPTGEVEKSLSGPPDKDAERAEESKVSVAVPETATAGGTVSGVVRPAGESAGAERPEADPQAKPTVVKTPTQVAPGNSVKPPPPQRRTAERPSSVEPEGTAAALGIGAAPSQSSEPQTVVGQPEPPGKKSA
jgi:sec-independent protein translocase protein TatB